MSKLRQTITAVGLASFIVLAAVPAQPQHNRPTNRTCSILDDLAAVVSSSLLYVELRLSIPQG